MAHANCWSRSCAALLAVLVFNNAWAGVRPAVLSAWPDPAEVLHPSAPDLVIESAGVQLAEECRPSAPLLYISAIIHNRGTAPVFASQWKNIVYARDTHARSWGNGLQLPGIAGGERQSVTFPIYFLNSAPGNMAGTHKFVIDVMAGNGVEEANYSNNRFGPVAVKVPIARCLNSRRAPENE